MAAPKITKIASIGAGYVGGPTMVVLADKCPHIEVVVYDLNKQRIEQWAEGDNLPIYEPGLLEILQKVRKQGNLTFTTDYEKVKDAQMIFLSVNTPTKVRGIGAGRAANTTYIELCARAIRENITSGHKIVVEKSTVPIRTSDIVSSILIDNNENDVTFDIVSNPEFLAEGTAIKDLQKPDRVLIGGNNPDAVEALATVYKNWVPEKNICTTNVWSSELSKLVANTMLAQRVSSINAISALCEKTGADVSEVARSIGMDTRIGPKFLNASVGFGGSCFQKDILNLVYLCEHYGLKPAADYFNSIITVNDWQRERFSHKIVHKMFNNIAHKKIAIFGFAFKQETGDTRESSSIFICKHLLEERANLSIWDPKVKEKQIFSDLQAVMDGTYHIDHPVATTSQISEIVQKQVTVATSFKEAVKGAHAIVVLTEWNEFKNYDYEEIANDMVKPPFVFDGRNILDREKLKKLGFLVYTIGKPDVQPKW